MIARWKIILIVVTLINLRNYLDIREILWSIVWLNIKGKYAKLKRYKQKLWDEHLLLDYLSMRFLENELRTHQKEFLFWWKIKKIFLFSELFLAIGYAYLSKNSNQIESNTIDMVYLIHSAIPFFFLRIQFGLDGKRTKFDRLRKK